MRSRPSTRAAATPVAAALFVLGSLGAGSMLTGCTDDQAPTSVLDDVAPTRAQVADQATIAFPASTRDFRLVRISGSQIDVTFTIATADTAAFASGSKLSFESGRRTIVHASPLWDVAVTGEVSGAESTENKVRRTAELVPDGDRTTVRLSIQPT